MLLSQHVELLTQHVNLLSQHFEKIVFELSTYNSTRRDTNST